MRGASRCLGARLCTCARCNHGASLLRCAKSKVKSLAFVVPCATLMVRMTAKGRPMKRLYTSSFSVSFELPSQMSFMKTLTEPGKMVSFECVLAKRADGFHVREWRLIVFRESSRCVEATVPGLQKLTVARVNTCTASVDIGVPPSLADLASIVSVGEHSRLLFSAVRHRDISCSASNIIIDNGDVLRSWGDAAILRV